MPGSSHFLSLFIKEDPAPPQQQHSLQHVEEGPAIRPAVPLDGDFVAAIKTAVQNAPDTAAYSKFETICAKLAKQPKFASDPDLLYPTAVAAAEVSGLTAAEISQGIVSAQKALENAKEDFANHAAQENAAKVDGKREEAARIRKAIKSKQEEIAQMENQASALDREADDNRKKITGVQERFDVALTAQTNQLNELAKHLQNA